MNNTSHICTKLKNYKIMSAFVISNQTESKEKVNTVSFTRSKTNQLTHGLKIVLFIVVFSALIVMSLRSNNLMLSELLVSGGILGLLFSMHLLSQK
jgi:predicted membrane channel-forming protein YqfA (hemolysin III family)